MWLEEAFPGYTMVLNALTSLRYTKYALVHSYHIQILMLQSFNFTISYCYTEDIYFHVSP